MKAKIKAFCVVVNKDSFPDFRMHTLSLEDVIAIDKALVSIGYAMSWAEFQERFNAEVVFVKMKLKWKHPK